jgi:hypothetical protein
MLLLFVSNHNNLVHVAAVDKNRMLKGITVYLMRFLTPLYSTFDGTSVLFSDEKCRSKMLLKKVIIFLCFKISHYTILTKKESTQNETQLIHGSCLGWELKIPKIIDWWISEFFGGLSFFRNQAVITIIVIQLTNYPGPAIAHHKYRRLQQKHANRTDVPGPETKPQHCWASNKEKKLNNTK